MCQRNAQMTVVISTTSRTLALDFAGAPYLSTQSNAQTLPGSRHRAAAILAAEPALFRDGRLPRNSTQDASGGNVAEERELVCMKVDVIVAAGRYLRYLMRRGTATW